MERICVAIRVKPTSRQEASSGTQWKVVANTISLHSAFGTPIKGHSYTFDTIFGTSIRNADIYKQHAKDLVLSAVSGFNGTIFAYGQTSSGKTYTMQGSASDQGVIRLAIQDVFTNIEKIEDREFLVRVSYMEIYNEEINDLLAPENRKLQIHENLERGIFVAGLREEIADSVEQVIAVLECGEAQRHFAETDMNVNSSRSHTIFRMVIESRDKSHDSSQDNDLSAQDAVRVSVLNLVDLAGSERISKTGAEGVRLKEGAHINKSLTTLGIVINKLSEGGGKQGAHVPYRDSKLTRILQSALGGNARTAIICTINPDEIHVDETRGTLQFASRAKRVTNCAQVNEILTDAALLKRQKEEIKELRRRLEGSPYSKDLKKEILHLRNDLLKYELGRERLELELQQEIKAQVERERRIKEQEQKIENLSKMVIHGAIEDRELPDKKNYRRETWCPQVSISNTLEQGLRRISSGKNQYSVSACVDANLRPSATRRDRTFGLPPAFESLVNDESDSFWSNSSGMDSSPTLTDFQNVADEDTWVSLNRGSQKEFAYIDDDDAWDNLNESHINTDCRSSQTSSEAENRRGSRQATLLVEGSTKIDMLKQQLNDMNLQYQNLQASMEFKIQEKTKEAVAAANNALLEEKSRFQLQVSRQEIMKLHGLVKDLEVELENRNRENTRLKADAMNLHDQLMHTREALEQRDQERVSMDEENEFCKQRLRSLELRIQDDRDQQFSIASRFGDDFAGDALEVNEISGICATCQYSTDVNSQRSSMQCGVFNSDCTFRRFSNENQNAQLSEILMHKVNKRRLFDDKDNSTFQAQEGKDQYWNESRTRSAPGNTAHTDDIRAALGRLCCRIKQLADPDVKRTESGRKQHRISQEAKNLKASFHLANRLGRELLQELHSIVNHDMECLEGHVALNGAVGKSLETLQVLLLSNAEVGLGLFHSLSSKESILGVHKLQQLMQEVANDGASNLEDDVLRKRSVKSSDGTQLISDESVYSIYSKHGAGLEGCLVNSKAARDTVVSSNTWDQSVEGPSLLSSQDPGEDICNIDLHQDCDEESGAVSNCHSNISLDVQTADELDNTDMGRKHPAEVQHDEILLEELKMTQNMSEAEKQFTKELLNKVKALEARLTIAEMEIVEYKVEIEHLRVKNLRASMEASHDSGDLELQALRDKCESQKEEIQQLMEQVMTPDDELERETLFRETMERNNFLENCLKKAERRLIRAKGWREELVQLREAKARKEKAYDDIQARNAVLENEGVLLRQDMSKAQQIDLTKDGDSNEHLDEVTKLEIINEDEPLKLQLLLSVGPKKLAIYSTPRKLGTTPAHNQDEPEHLKGPSCRPPRAALGDIQGNLLQPLTSKDLGGYTCPRPDVRKSQMIDTSDKENRPCPQGLFTTAH
ncbi:hypothetical protein M758_1G068000 [Ceratodon purpureus]|nr:hypothetical protein M758_1G068000 [Ceratodon purpureus]